MENKNTNSFKPVEKILKKCEDIEKKSSNKDSEYKRVMDIIFDNIYKNCEGFKEIVNKALDDKGRTDASYQYAIGIMVHNSYKNVPDYKNKENHLEKINNFIEKAKSRLEVYEEVV